MLALLSLCALADPVARPVPAGSSVTAEVTSWLLPEAQLDRCLLNTQELTVCRKSLTDCAETGRESLLQAADSLRRAQTRQEADADAVARCAARTEVLTMQRDVAQRQARTNGAVAVGAVVIAGLVAGLAL